MIDLTFLTPSQGSIVRGDAAGDQAGRRVSSAGDVNGDGFADLIVGAPLGDDGGADAGEAYVVFGKSSGFGTVDGTGRSVIDLTNVASSFTAAQGFVVRGDAAGDRAGWSVASAGDVNGDGFADLIVGAPLGDDGGDRAGEAYVVFGRASGFGTVDGTGRSVIDLTNVASSFTAVRGFIIQGDAAYDQAGYSVSAAGDVNGDGFADLVVGAPLGGGAGEAYVVFGRASGFGTVDGTGRSVIDLTNVGSSFTASQGFVIQGDTASDFAGWSVSSAGDVNGDGFADLIVGAPFGDDGGSSAGEAYVVFGKSSGFGTVDGTGRSVIDLTNVASSFTASQGFVIQGDAANDRAGYSVSSAGDVNGDGFADLIVGAPLGDDGGSSAGEAYVVFGTASGFGTVDGTGRSVIDLTNVASSFTASRGFVVRGDAAADFAGFSVSSAGDVNGDGFADLIVGAPRGNDGGIDAGEAYVLFGKASGFGTVDGSGRSVIDLTGLSGVDGFIVQGDAGSDQAGRSVSAAGDVDGDGFADLIVGAPGGGDGGAGAGEAYVLFGGLFGGSTAPVSTAGTGAAEILIGAAGADTLSGGGGADSIRGGAGDDALSVGNLAFRSVDGGGGVDTLALAGSGLTLDLTDRPQAAKVSGIERIDLAGTGNNTLRLDRLAVLNEVGANAGGVHVLTVAGNAGDTVSFVEVEWGKAGTIVQGAVTYDRYVNGDAEVRIAQAVAVAFPLDLTVLAPSQGFIVQGDAAGEGAGFSVSSAGDVNGDGFADLIVGAPSGAGKAYVVFGRASGFGAVDGTGRSVIDLTNVASSFTASQGFVVQVDSGEAGWSVSSAGDVNGDGFADVIVGAPVGNDGGHNTGEAYVVFGKASGFGTVDGTGRSVIDLTTFSSADGFIVQGETPYDAPYDYDYDNNGYAGTSVSAAGDVNGDGFADLIVGAPRDHPGHDAGKTYVLFGRASGFGTVDGTGRSVIDLAGFSAAQGFIVLGDANGDQSGRSVSGAGDVNGDGFADLVVGAPFGDDGGSNAGEAYVVFGKASGFGTIDLTNVGSSFTASQGFVIQGDAADDFAGWSVSSAGDVNGDGFADLIVGARYGDDGGSDAGEAYVVFGTASGFGTVDGTGRSVIDLTNVASSFTASRGFIVRGDAAGDQAGFSVSSAGDVNGDGFADLIVGAPYGDDGGGSAGEAYVVFGKASGFGTVDGSGRSVIDLTGLSAVDGLIVRGDAAGDQAGFSVSAAGDVNGDGFADLIVGAPGGGDGGAGAGEAYVLFGGLFGGSTAPVSTTGTGAAEILIGGAGADTLSGGGGADSIRGGTGDDALSVGNLAFRSVDGGGGVDTLALAGSGLSLDLSNRLQAAKVSGIERIDLAGTGNNTLRLDRLAVLNEVGANAGGVHVLTVAGNAGDTVSFVEVEWGKAGTIVQGAVTYDRYVNGDAEVRIAQAVTVSFPHPFDLTFLAPSQGFLVQGDAAGDQAGRSVSSAGDVNGDGFADLIVGAPLGDDGGADAGEAYVVFGKSSGFGTVDGTGRSVIDLTNVAASFTAAQGFIVRGDAAGDQAGWSVASAGDVNGDGFADLIVGAPLGDDGGDRAGEAYVVFGRASGFGTVDGTGRSVIDLTNVASGFTASRGFVVRGDAANDRGGYSVSAAGDVNGDGFADLIVGAPLGDDGGGNAGEAYVVFGRASGFGTVDGTGRSVIDLTNVGSSFTASQGFIVRGDATFDNAGWSVSSAGDVNGDGFADLIVGAPFGDDGGSSAGEAYVVFGKSSGFGTVDGTGRSVIDLTNVASSFTASQGFVIQGDAANDRAGYSVSSAGDVNGDGFADLIVGAPLGDDGGSSAGEAYVVFGTASGFGTVDGTGRSVIDLTNVASSFTASRGFVVRGDAAADFAGFSVSSAGDVNGDGFADLIVGAPRGNDGGIDAGEAYVLFGKASGFGTVDGSGRAVIDLTGLSAADGFIVQGDAAGDQAGFSVSAAGDVNGDGFADLIVGAPYGDDGGSAAGEAYVLLGGAFGGSTAPVSTTGTGAAEILIGAAGADTLSGGGGADSIRGGAGDDALSVGNLAFRSVDGGGGVDTLALAGSGLTLDLTDRLQAAKVSGIERIDLAGTGNNTLRLDRLAVLNEVGANAGGVHVLTVAGNAGDTVSFAEVEWGKAGTIVQGAVTFNRYVDGDAEVRIAQAVTIAFPLDLTFLAPSQGFIVQGDAAGDQAGRSVSSAGDVNGDGFADLIVGAPFGDDGGSDAGEAYVVFGKSSGFGTVDGTGRSVIDLSNVGSSFTASQGFVVRGDAAGDRAGWSVASAGDVNGDGFADLIVGAPLGNDGGSGAGETYVVFGKASGFGTADGTSRSVIDLTNVGSGFTAAQGFVVQGDAAGDRAGYSVSAAGDVNGDGFADLIVGAPFGGDGGGSAGEAYVVFGTASGFGTVDGTGRSVIDLTNVASSFTAAQGFVVRGDAAGDWAGWSVSSAGDVNGDGFADLVVGAPLGDDGGSSAGEAYVVFGKASGFGTVDGTGRSVIDLTNVASSFTAARGFVIQGDAANDRAGYSVSSAGDVNGDGFADLIVGAPLGDDGGGNAGEAYVVFGHASGFGTVDGTGRSVIDLTNVASGFTASRGFVVRGDAAADFAGFSVSAAGDVNGDGFADLIVGAPLGDDGGSSAGEVYVVFGKASGFGTVDGSGRSVIDLTGLSGVDGFIVQGDAGSDQAGRSVSAAGDVDGDGFADLIVGAPGGGDGGAGAGEAYVLFGGLFGGSTAPVSTTGTAAAEILIGGAGNDTLSGGGGADSIRGGAGDDALSVGNLAFRSVDGGGGIDTLALAGSGQSFDFTTIADDRIAGIEALDITGSGNNSLTLGFADVAAMTDANSFAFTVADSHRALVVEGNTGDSVTLQDYDPDGAGGVAAAIWTQVASNVGLAGFPGGTYDVYDLQRGSSVLASVAVDADILKI